MLGKDRRRRKHIRRAILAASGMVAGVGIAASAAFLARRRGRDISGQTVLITGGSRGLGLELAREFASEGCRIAISARDAGELDRARRDLEERGARVHTVVCDVADRAQVESMVASAARAFGRIDILVNNAGTIQVGPLETMTVADFENAMAVMFWGTLYAALAVLPGMLERGGGRIVNITSIGGKVSVPHLLPYSCAKAAAVALSEGLRAELAGKRVRVITIVPGLMRTGSYLNAFFKGRQEREHAWFALGAALPGVSMNAGRAARQIVTATRRGTAERILTPQASLLARFHGVFPGTTASILGLVNRALLPSPGGAGEHSGRGNEIEERMRSRVLSALTIFGRGAARRTHQYPEQAPAS